MGSLCRQLLVLQRKEGNGEGKEWRQNLEQRRGNVSCKDSGTQLSGDGVQGAPVSCHGVNGAPSRCLTGSAGQTGCFNILGLACPALDKEVLEADRGALSTLFFPGAISNRRFDKCRHQNSRHISHQAEV